MASLYKKPVIMTDPKTGERVKTKSKKWWGRFKDHLGIERRVPLALDKTAAQTMLTNLVKKAERQAAGIVDRFDDHRRRPIAHHLVDFEKHLKSKGACSAHFSLVVMRARRVAEGTKAVRIGDLSASKVQTFLAELRASGKSVQTSNHYLRAIKQFTRWLLFDHRASDNPLAHIAMLNVSTDRRHDRRPFTEAELHAILKAAQQGPVFRKMSGPDRAMLYAVAAYTGLRASELASLTPESFCLEDQPPRVTVQAAYSKHRRQDVLPLHESIVALLRPWLTARPAGQPVWPGAWAQNKHAGDFLRFDMERARTAWIKEAGHDEAERERREASTFLVYKDPEGRFADFHALRHTFITNLVKSGVHPKEAQALARHSTIALTMNVYTSLTVNDQASALASLPPVPALAGGVSGTEVVRATGTDGGTW
jgi:integrase